MQRAIGAPPPLVVDAVLHVVVVLVRARHQILFARQRGRDQPHVHVGQLWCGAVLGGGGGGGGGGGWRGKKSPPRAEVRARAAQSTPHLHATAIRLAFGEVAGREEVGERVREPGRQEMVIARVAVGLTTL